MPSTASPFGLRPVFHMSGGLVRPTSGTILNSYATAIYQGAPVKIHTDGTLNLAAAGDDEFIVGSFLGVEYTESTGVRKVTNFWPGAVSGATDIVAYYYNDPNIVYLMQSDDSVALADIGSHGNLVNPGAGSSNTGVSTAALDDSTLSASTAKQLQIIAIAPGPFNEAGDTYTNVYVKIAQHQFAARPAAF